MIKERFYIVKSHQLDVVLDDNDYRSFNDENESISLSIEVSKAIINLGFDRDDVIRTEVKNNGKLLEVQLDVNDVTKIYERYFRGYVIPLDTYVEIPLPKELDCDKVLQVIDIISTEESIDYTLKHLVPIKYSKVEVDRQDASNSDESDFSAKEIEFSMGGEIFKEEI